ncbi:MAG: 7-carboxy-7-deazaguanine synthase QueE [Porphyromonas sp.]|nr:7-carboxy-7-deazaguanine synthase QueE [Porphyromonas sp.]
MRVVEIFKSIQGEGANTGRLATFVRLAGCNLNCWYCDTEWRHGIDMSLEEITRRVEALGCRFLIWTGGEPTLQLTEEVVAHFKALGYTQAIETNGTITPPKGIDYISCSPKVGLEVLRKTFANRTIGELRYPYGAEIETPPAIEELPPAEHYFVSPIFLGKERVREEYRPEHLALCLDFIEKDPRWRLSLQVHKLINVP